MQPGSAMLRFIQLLPQVSPKGDFILKDLPGSGKRIDILCRDLAACFSWGPITWLKASLELIAIIADTTILTFRHPGDEIPQNEVGWALVIRNSLREQPPEWVSVSNGSVEEIIKMYSNPPESTLWVLDEKGSHVSEIETKLHITQNSFMLGNHKGFNSQTEELIAKYKLPRVSLGKKSYLSSHCVASIISEFERSENVE
ncbi:MAG: hypothetical protein E3J86_14315 [Candidatus Thorarchaeota archaeon]|nr:MAG: hypothetical protein E3J86_14315 [Candidatus Thorarchaeota archaeon]